MRLRSYEIGEQIGAGATSEVYEAWVRKTGEPVAIKLLHVTRTPAMADSMHREAQLAPRLVHPHIARVHDVLWDAHGPTCLVMELVEGVPLSDIMRSLRPVSSPIAIAIVRPVLRALDYAHREVRIAHRDVSPKNIVVGWGGTVKLVDFGVAKLIGAEPTTGLFKGTPRYLSPEQVLGADVDGRADVFAVGVILYELLTGRHLFAGETTNEILAHVVAGDPAPAPRTLCAEIPATVSDAVMTMIERDRERRVASAADALEALPVWPESQVLLAALMRKLRDDHEGPRKLDEVHSRSIAASRCPTAVPPLLRHGLWALAAVALVALCIVGAWALWIDPTSRPVDPETTHRKATVETQAGSSENQQTTADETAAVCELPPTAESMPIGAQPLAATGETQHSERPVSPAPNAKGRQIERRHRRSDSPPRRSEPGRTLPSIIAVPQSSGAIEPWCLTDTKEAYVRCK